MANSNVTLTFFRTTTPADNSTTVCATFETPKGRVSFTGIGEGTKCRKAIWVLGDALRWAPEDRTRPPKINVMTQANLTRAVGAWVARNS